MNRNNDIGIGMMAINKEKTIRDEGDEGGMELNRKEQIKGKGQNK